MQITRRWLFLAPAAIAAARQREPGAVKPDPAFAPIEDVPGLPRVLLIGDSISIGYTPFVREILKGKANVHRIPANGAATIHGIQSIAEWLGAGKWDVIHFNWGLHDIKIVENSRHQVDMEPYGHNLELLVARMKKTGAVLIWASTTPVPEGGVSPPRIPTDVNVYNDVAKAVMEKHGVRIDDLYSAMLPKLAEFQLPVNVHFKPEGYKFLAERVAAEIRKALQGGRSGA